MIRGWSVIALVICLMLIWYLNLHHSLSSVFGHQLPIPSEQRHKIWLVTTWRSGSTFLGDILNAYPGTFYHYEPLLHYGIKQIRDGDKEYNETKIIIQNLFNCNYTGLNDMFRYAKTHYHVFSHNHRLWNHCSKGKNPLCWEADFVSRKCSRNPVQMMKTVRIRLKMALELLREGVIYLVRDPRGTLQSRKHRSWCPKQPDCSDPTQLCRDLVDDFYAAVSGVEEFPNALRVIRYEDFSLDPLENSRRLFSFLGLLNDHLHPDVRDFIVTHTQSDQGGVSSTFRNISSAPYHWKQDLHFQEIVSIQDHCKEAMNLWKYRLFKSAKELASHSVLPMTR